MARNILACYNELFAKNAALFSQNIQINHVLADHNDNPSTGNKHDNFQEQHYPAGAP